MKYLGIACIEDKKVLMPDAFKSLETTQSYEATEVGGDIILITFPLDRKHLELIDKFTNQSIDDHRQTLMGLAH